MVADPIMVATAREMRPSAGIYVPDKDAYHLSWLCQHCVSLTTPPFIVTVAEGPTVASAQESNVIWHQSKPRNRRGDTYILSSPSWIGDRRSGRSRDCYRCCCPISRLECYRRALSPCSWKHPCEHDHQSRFGYHIAMLGKSGKYSGEPDSPSSVVYMPSPR